MDITKIIDTLNDMQRQAVTAPDKAVLVLAGAGSGKTRVLVHRIAWQIQVGGIPPHCILAVTFTNKAAREMRNRLEELLNMSAHTLWIGTFHGLAHRLLRRHAKEAKLPENFQVMDSADQLRLVKRILATMNLDEGKWPPKQVQWYINAQKDDGKRARHLLDSGDFFQRQMLAVYKTYEETCDRSGLVDFAELLLRVHELMRDNPDLLDFYHRRFLQVHVDEFQDTNTIQYAWLRLLTEGKNNIFIVGDDDQSIYGWRGARVENIYNFQRHYPDHQVIKLEQNYRSTGNILKAANKVISMNEARLGKELWTESGDGELISLYAAFNEIDEAYFVVERIKAWVNEGGSRSDVAILYRSNAQSRQFEEKLMVSAMPYRVYGGLRFFDRAEIKNALAYLRLIANRHDDASFERVVNTPVRGLGTKAIDHIRLIAKENEASLWIAANTLVELGALSSRARNALSGFLELVARLEEVTQTLELHQKVQMVNEHSGLVSLYKNEKGDRGEEKLENLDELINAARLFDHDKDRDEELSELDSFLTHAALEAGEMQGEEYDDCVQLMTLHSAKGLEFKLVFLVGLEEGLFPSQQSSDDINRLEEERRLCYVGMTRAMSQLYLTYAESRRIYGRETYSRPSRFLREIPNEHLQEIRMRANVNRPMSVSPMGGSSVNQSVSQARRFKLGQTVSHAKFGEGVVLQVEGEGAQERVQINFKNVGMKWLMLSYAQLEAL